jgi:hypothetical protein
MQVLESLCDQRDIAGTDLEQAVAAERTSPAALQILRLGLGDGAKEIVRAIEDARIRFIVRFFRHGTHNR